MKPRIISSTFFEKLTGSQDLLKYKEGMIQLSPKAVDDLEAKLLDHFNVCKWFALLVNHNEIRELLAGTYRKTRIYTCHLLRKSLVKFKYSN